MEFERTILPGIGETHRGRISVVEADRLARQKDALLPGQVLQSTETDMLPDILSLPGGLNESIMELSVVDAAEVVEDQALRVFGVDDTQQADVYYAFRQGLLTAEAIGDILQNLADEDLKTAAVSSNQSELKDQTDYLRNSIALFRDQFPDAELKPDAAGSMQWLGRFIDFYKKRIHQELGSAEVVLYLRGQRQLLVETLHGTTMKRYLGARNAERIADHFQQQPLIIVDPLSVLLLHRGKGNLLVGTSPAPGGVTSIHYQFDSIPQP